MNYLKLQQDLIKELVNEPKKKQFIRIGRIDGNVAILTERSKGVCRMNEIKLKNCPFCGSEVELEDIGEDSNDHYYMIACKNSSCGSSTCFGEVSKDDFIRTWNKRKPIYDMVEKMEREYLGKPVSEEFESGICRAIEIAKECAE